MSLTKEARPKSNLHVVQGVEVARAQPKHVRENQRIYQEGRIAAQAHGALTVAKMVAEFRNPNSTMVGRTTGQWSDMIRDMSGRVAVFNSFRASADTSKHDDMPKGIVRARKDPETGLRYLESLYVVADERHRGHGQALFSAVKEWHEGEEFRLRVAGYNGEAIGFYQKLGCVATEEEELGYEIQGVFVPQIEMISPATNEAIC